LKIYSTVGGLVLRSRVAELTEEFSDRDGDFEVIDTDLNNFVRVEYTHKNLSVEERALVRP